MASTATSTLQPTLDRLDQLAALPADWDSYGADPPTPTAIAGARQILLSVVQPIVDLGTHAEPWTIGARADGGVMIEWRERDAALEIHVEPNGTFGYLHEDGSLPSSRYVERNNVSMADLGPVLPIEPRSNV